jgi:hypothetical protein
VALPGRGKRGGARIIYYDWTAEDRCYLLYGYAKATTSDLTPRQLRRLSDLMLEERHDG